MKKVLITASTLPRWKGDSEPRFVLDFAKAISNKYEVTILVPWSKGAQEREKLEGINIIRYHYFPIRRCETLCYPGAILGRVKEKKIRGLLVPFLILSQMMQLFRYLGKYDYAVAHWIIPQGIVQSFFKKPYMLICHGSDVRAMNKGIVKKLKKRALQKAEAVVVVSNELRQQVEQIFGVGDVVVQPMGVDISEFCIPVEEKEKKDGKIILFVGRLDKIKGIEYLIGAMEYMDAKLVIVGDGILREKLEMQAKKYGDKVKFMGAVEHSKLPYIYAKADVFVAPSITLENGATEGFGLVLVEALAAGIPVIGTRTGGMKDIILDNENGYFVEEKNSRMIADKVNYLLNNREVYERLAGNAKQTIRKYDWNYVGEEYARLIGENIDSEVS